MQITSLALYMPVSRMRVDPRTVPRSACRGPARNTSVSTAALIRSFIPATSRPPDVVAAAFAADSSAWLTRGAGFTERGLDLARRNGRVTRILRSPGNRGLT